jgi:hypothetical protein
MLRWSCHLAANAVLIGLIVGLVFLAGCSKPYDGVSDADRELQAKQAAADAAKSQGMKITEKSYPLGKAWVVDLEGMTITDEHIRKLKDLGHVAELDLGNSTVTDEQLAALRENGAATTLFRLDLSHTGVTDAGLAKLEGLPFLVNLNVSDSKITAAGVEHYKKSRLSNSQIQPGFRKANVTR